MPYGEHRRPEIGPIHRSENRSSRHDRSIVSSSILDSPLDPVQHIRMRDLDNLFAALRRSPFRQRFRLGARDRAYLETKGLHKVLEHAAEFVAQRLAPAMPRNDGKQTPFRGHPAFVAQHATATCCRGCLAKW